MIAFPNCKINLGLKIINKRQDGFHNIETIFYPIPWLDALEVIETGKGVHPIQFSTTGITIQGNPAENLCVKAYELIKKKFSQLPGIRLHLHKSIPPGAGLGGGSSDAAFTLKLLNQEFKLNLSSAEILEIALQLGSDVPFFLTNNPCLAAGRGELLKSVEIDLSSYKVVLVHPGIHINTHWAFSQLNVPDTDAGRIDYLNILVESPEQWENRLQNDFEPIVFKKYPEIKNIKTKLSDSGASYCSLSGSGSCVYGLFKKDIIVPLDFPPSYIIKQFNL